MTGVKGKGIIKGKDGKEMDTKKDYTVWHTDERIEKNML
jgi:hypothetical protein